MTAEQLRGALLHRWQLVAVLALCMGVGAFVVSQFMGHQYRSFALVQLVVNPAIADPGYALGGGDLIATQNQLATSPSLLAAVAKQFPGLTASKLASEVEATQYGQTTLMEIQVLDASPTRAAALANAIAAQVIAVQEQTREQQDIAYLKPYEDKLAALQQDIATTSATLQTLAVTPANAKQITTLQAHLQSVQAEDSKQEQTIAQIEINQTLQGFTLQLAEPAEPNYTAVRPILLANVLGGVISGILAGILLVIALELRDMQTLVTTGFLTDIELPVLASLVVGAEQDGQNTPTYPQGEFTSSDTQPDAYRRIWTALELWSIEQPVRVLTISSIGAGALSSLIAANAAVSLAGLGESALLIEAPSSQPAQARRFGIPAEHGLNDAVLAWRHSTPADASGVTRFMYAANGVHAPNLRIMPAGNPWANARQALGSAAMAGVLEAALVAGAQRVVLDAPDASGSAATRALAAKSDGILLVLDAALVRKHQLLHAQNELANAGIRVLGCVWVQRSVANGPASLRRPDVPGTTWRTPDEREASAAGAHRLPVSENQPGHG